MAYEVKPNTGSIFRETNPKSENSPAYTGTLMVTEPGEYRIAAWVNDAANGTKYQSLKLTLKDEQPQSRPAPQASIMDDEEEDVPF